jgi:hypothetical protein
MAGHLELPAVVGGPDQKVQLMGAGQIPDPPIAQDRASAGFAHDDLIVPIASRSKPEAEAERFAVGPQRKNLITVGTLNSLKGVLIVDSQPLSRDPFCICDAW